MNFASLVRHWFTLAASSATVFLIGTLTLSQEDGKNLAEAFSALLEPAMVIVTILAVAVWRLFLAKAGTLFRHGAGENGNESNGGGSGGNPLPCVLWLGMAAAIFGGLPSCSTQRGAWSGELRGKGFELRGEGDFNPLDEPGSLPPTVEDLHRGNVKAITQNPAY